MPFSFKVIKQDKLSGARAGVLTTPHGEINTPVFMPVGTQATVKAVLQKDLMEMGAQIILSNTYHLYLRPGHELVEKAGGLHKFMGWDRPILTDSGGFQVFSLSKMRKITEDGVQFSSHIDGSRHFIGPEKAMDIQRALGSDIIMAFDECSAHDCGREYASQAMQRTHRWLERCDKQYRQVCDSQKQMLFPIVQGNMYNDLRRQSLETILPYARVGFSIGGLSVGEPKDIMYDVLENLQPHYPPHLARYLMGVGSADCLVEGVLRGIDMFDCVLATRIARNGTAMTKTGKLVVKNAAYKEDFTPIEKDCGCYTCQNFSRGYIRHLINSGEIAGGMLISIHNLYFLLQLMSDMRTAILDDVFMDFYNEFKKYYTI